MCRILASLTAAVLLGAVGAEAQTTLVESDDVSLGLSGYVLSLTGIADQGYDVPEIDRRSGFHSEVVRLKWKLSGNGWTAEVHNRLQADVSSQDADFRVVGFGVSAVPDRSVDLRSTLVDESGLRVWHDVDRLNVTVLTDAVDVTVGRQAITWGISAIFPVADLWAQFSPYELDTEEKPGIDAVRALLYPAQGLEVDAVVADRGSIDDLSAGVRGTLGLSGADVWAGAGKFWREIIAMGGVTVLLDETRLRAEAALPWDMDGEGMQDPRLTLGADWIRGTFTLTGEYHLNGLGAADPDGYVARLQAPDFARGESYYLGRHYLGALLGWSPDEENRLNLALSALTNLGDGSLGLTPAVSYDIGQSTRVSLGGFVSFGRTPVLATPPRLRSEFGAYGDLAFTRVSVYF